MSAHPKIFLVWDNISIFSGGERMMKILEQAKKFSDYRKKQTDMMKYKNNEAKGLHFNLPNCMY